ncbi:hypothetical protein [Protofrankia sp. BMG5.30]|uniref:hypothetical protein n=1 Tax=Protofrankia sp. BMG5.30 TaxID=1834514 RepID=UPI000977BB86|nr:hypothetical protein [Protofrankia sp. BMG5.30]ONH34584.1 hypothetical protein BL254_15200 [Protofrankia sp. BMG5.30]
MTTARRRDEDGHGSDAARQPGGYGDPDGLRGVREDADSRADIQDVRSGMPPVADLGDARPVSLLGLRMPDLEGERDATVSRRASRPRPGGRGDGAPARPGGTRADAGRRTPSRPTRGETRPAARGGERSHTGPGDTGSGIPGSGVSGAGIPEPGVAEGGRTGPDVTGSSVRGATAPDTGAPNSGVAGVPVSEAPVSDVPARGAAVPGGGGTGAVGGAGAVVVRSGIAGAGVIGAGGEPGQAGSEAAGDGVAGAGGAGIRPGTGGTDGLGGLEAPAAAGRPPVRAPDGPGWTPDVGEFRAGVAPVSAGLPQARATATGHLTAGHGGLDGGLGSGLGSALDMVATRCQWVHVGGLEGGCGRTTVTAGIAMALVASRRDRIIAVDVSPEQPGALAARLGPPAGRGTGRGPGRGELARAASGLPASLPEIRRFAPGAGATGPAGPLVSTGPLGSAGPVGLVGLAGPASTGPDVMMGASGADVDGRPAGDAGGVEDAGRVEEVGRALDAVGEWYEVALVDSPPGWSRPLPAALLARADALVLTVRASAVALSAVDDALDGLAGSGRGELAGSVTIAVVETGPTRWSGRARRRLARLAERGHTIVVVPFDPVLAGGRAVAWSGLRRRTRAAFGELAAAVDPGIC